eukprot:CAMPEP_0204491878 /NCGR_PEP_ID=MMETSP0471-20130131/78310_1 /ASSEMBLY_ACC=CAM_ASM_000602 /TAXON_ID=2969 /ORGANISM="Oxyrrhis marina" /LENGTH=57 /DNA_ID=CAMNT_0051495903 /DNA_START=536 /DNA_END=709 /DNA_ORIENTATION=+
MSNNETILMLAVLTSWGLELPDRGVAVLVAPSLRLSFMSIPNTLVRCSTSTGPLSDW